MASWSTGNTVAFDDLTPGAGVTAVADINLESLAYNAVVIQVKVVFGGSVDGDTVVDIRYSPDGGTTYDTVAFSTKTFTAVNGATVTQSFYVENVNFVQVAVTNNDSADDVTPTLIYAGGRHI